MAINWTDNKVFNPNTQQRMPMNERTNNAATRPIPGLTEDNIQMEKYTNNQKMMNEKMMNEDMMNENMMNNRMMSENRMNDNMMNKMIIEDQLRNDMMTDRMGPPPVMNREYIAGYLKENIGRGVRAEFPLAGGFYVDKAGILKDVGVNYFVLEDYITHARILCDLYSVKFVTIL